MLFSIIILSSFVFLLLNNMVDIVSPKQVDLIQLLVMTIQNFHNQTYYLLPVTSTLILVMVRKVTPQEFYWLYTKKQIQKFCFTQVVSLFLGYLCSLLIGTIFFELMNSKLTHLSLSNLFLGIGFLTIHFFGVLLVCYLLVILVLFFNKITTYLIFWGFIYLDIVLLTHLNLSLVIGNGLTMDIDTFNIISAVKDFILYVIYFKLITKCTKSFLLRGLRI